MALARWVACSTSCRAARNWIAPAGSPPCSVQKVQSGGAGFGADLVVNAPVVPGRAALRAVMYATTEPGWIDNSGARDNANDTRVLGGRLALRALLPADWTLDLQGVAQNSQTSDSQYVTGSSGLRRSGVLPEPHDNDFYLGVATAQGRWLGQNALVTSSAVSHESDGILDASVAAGSVGRDGTRCAIGTNVATVS